MNRLKENLTILLLTKDRLEFSKRWLKFASITQQDIPILIADGSINDSLRAEVELYNHLNIQYFYPGPDLSITHFISKTVISLKSVKTKYTFMVSDDDFYTTDILEKSVNFLETNGDATLCNGGALDFALSVRPTSINSIYGQIRYIRKFGVYESYLEDQAVKRVTRYLKSNRSYWHSVITTDCLLKSWEKAAELKLTRYDTLENFLNLYWLTQGKFMNLEKEILLFHQVHNDMISQTLEDSASQQSNEIWKSETLKIKKYIESKLGEKLLLSEHDTSLKKIVAEKNLSAQGILDDFFSLFSIFFKKVKFKIEDKLHIEPKMDLSFLDISERVVNQIKEIEKFLQYKK